MALGTTLQYTESNLIGTLYAPITSSATTIQVQFTDKVTGAARTPDATTKLFVVDKGSENAPNPNYEIVLVGSHSTTSGITTLTGCTRGLAFTGYSLAAVTANQKAHTAGAVIGCVDVHFMWNTLVSTLKGTGDSMVVTTFATEAALASDVPSPTNGQVVYVTALNSFLFRNNSKWWGTPILVFADATARDASITSPSNGMQVYLTTEGKYTDYTAGAWADRASGTTPNMSTSVAGKGEEATAAEIIANTQTGGTGADLIVNPKYLSDASVTTSAGAGDAGKYVRANGNGRIDNSLLPITGIQVTAGSTGSQGDLLEISSSNTTTSLKRNITKNTNFVLTIPSSGTPDVYGGYVNNNGQKVFLKAANIIVGIYPGDDTVRSFLCTKSAITNEWSVTSTGTSPALTGGAINTAFVVSDTIDQFGLIGSSSGATTILFYRVSGGTTSVSGSNYTGIQTCNLRTNVELVLYDLFATGYMAVVVDHTGALSTGSVLTVSARSGGTFMRPGMAKLNTDKAFLIFSNAADNVIQGMVVSVSGTTITPNTASTIESGSITSADGVIFSYSLYDNQGITDKAVIVLRRTSGAVTAYLIEVTGTTFTATPMSGLPNQNFYGLIASDTVLVGTSVSTAVGYKIDTTNLRFVQCTNAYSSISNGDFSGIVYDSNQAVSTVIFSGVSLELANISPTHEAPLVALSNYTNGSPTYVSNVGEVTVPSIAGTAGNIQYLTFSGTSNNRINIATSIGVAKNSTTIILN